MAALVSSGACFVFAAGASTRLVVAYTKPGGLRPGVSRTMTLFGAGFDAAGGGAAPNVSIGGDGVTVNAATLVSAERLRLSVTVAANATPGPRDVTVIRSDGASRTARSVLVVGVGRPPTAKGRVRLATGAQPVSDARVTLFKPDLSTIREARTSVSGRWAMVGVPSGSYRLGVAAEGYDYQERDLTLQVSARGDFRLVPESHPGAWAVIGDTAPELSHTRGRARPDRLGAAPVR